MKNRKRFLILLVALALPVAGVVWWKNVNSGTCQVCDRKECRAVLFGLRTRWGFPVKTCCPRCAITAMKNTPGLKAVYATDFSTGREVDAKTAIYVEGGNTVMCHKAEAFPDEVRGAANFTVYDRCLPSLIAFGNQKEAEEYQRTHGGTIFTFDQLVAFQKAGFEKKRTG